MIEAQLSQPKVEECTIGSPSIRVIKPGKGSLRNLLKDIWEYRETAYFLTWRDVKVRYKQTVLGVLWAVIQPVMTMVVMSLVLGRFLGLSRHTGHVPYPIFLYSGLLPWTLFTSAISGCSGSVIANSSLVGKVRFPRIMLPISAVMSCLVDFAIACTVLFVLMAWYHFSITARLLWSPFLLIGIAGIALGFGCVFAALSVAYRDFKYIIPFMTQIWMYLTPVMYPSSMIPPHMRWLFSLNPLTGLINGFRYVFLGGRLDPLQLEVSTASTVFALVFGMYYFRSLERRFADII